MLPNLGALTLVACRLASFPLRWVKAGSGYGQAMLRLLTTESFMVYFESMKCSGGFCFVACYCYVADNVNKQVGFHANTLPSHKQRPLVQNISAYTVPDVGFNQANLVPFECSSYAEFRTGKKV